VNKGHWQVGRLHTFIGVTTRWGVEVSFDVAEPALALHLLNVYVVFEWWPKEYDY